MKVGIIGSGTVGRVLGSAFLKEGHSVILGTRNTAKPEILKWQEENAGAVTGSFADAASAELLILTIAATAIPEVIESAGIENFKGKIVIDTTNPIAHEPAVNGVLKYFTDINESLMERTKKIIPQSRLVKAFNSVGANIMYKPAFKSGPATMFICGDDEDAKKTVTHILDSFGWETEDMGKAEAARAIEPLCMLWCIPGFLKNQWTHAFKLMKD